METKLIVARHGNTFRKGEVVLRAGSHTDVPLVEEGLKQGERLAEKLSSLNLVPNRFFAGDLLRTKEMCAVVKKYFRQTSNVEVLDFLTELDYGIDDGKPEVDVVLRLGLAEAERKGRSIADATKEELTALGKAALKRWDLDAILPAGWQFLTPRVSDLPNRWREFAMRVAEVYRGETTFVCTSNGVARFSTSILPDEFPRPLSLKLATGAYALYIYDDDDKTWRLVEWNGLPVE